MVSQKTIARFIISSYLIIFFSINHYHIEWLVSSWLKSTHYQHTLFFLFIIAVLVIKKIRSKRWKYKPLSYNLKWSNIIIPLLILGISLLAEYYFRAPFLGAISVWMLLVFFIYKCVIMRNYERFYIVLLLLIITPFPYIYHLTSYLQISTSYLSASLIGLFGVQSEVSHGTVVLESGTFIVGPASSGIRSFLVLPTFSIVLLLWRPYKIKLGFVFILLSFFTAQFYNMIRVSAMLVTAIFTDPMWAYDAFHDKGNTVVFFMAMTSIYWLYKKICQK